LNRIDRTAAREVCIALGIECHGAGESYGSQNCFSEKLKGSFLMR
jgi:hypothetical protein